MSNTINPSQYIQTVLPPPQFNWIEVSTAVSALFFCTLAAAGFILAGVNPLLGAASFYVGCCAASLEGLTIFGSLIYKAVQSVKKQTHTEELDNSFPLEDHSFKKISTLADLPDTPLKERLPVDPSDRRDCPDTVYSKNRPDDDKNRIHTDFGVRQGILDQKQGTLPFISDFSIDPSRYIDPHNQLPQIGAATTRDKRFFSTLTHLATQLNFQGKTARLIGVFDPEASLKASTYVRNHLPIQLEEALENSETLDHTSISNILTESFIKLNQSIQEIGDTTACCALILDDTIYIPNLGDSRALLIRPEGPYQLTEEIAPQWHSDENTRSARPKISRIEKEIEDNFETMHLSYAPEDILVFGTRALGTVARNSEIYAMIQEMQTLGLSETQMAATLVQTAKERCQSSKSISVLVVKL